MVFHPGMGRDESGLGPSGTWNPRSSHGGNGTVAEKTKMPGSILSGIVPVAYMVLPFLEECLGDVLPLDYSVFTSVDVFTGIYQFDDEAECRNHVPV